MGATVQPAGAQGASENADALLRPGRASIDGFQDARTVVAVPRKVLLARTHVNDLAWTRSTATCWGRINCNRPNGQRGLVIAHRDPACPAIDCLPDSACGSTQVRHVSVRRIDGECRDAPRVA